MAQRILSRFRVLVRRMRGRPPCNARFILPQRAPPPAASDLLGLLPLQVQATGMPEPPSLLIVGSILLGLPAALWAYKCLMMVVFQRKIIYMGYAPLGARKERLEDVPSQYLRGIDCEEIKIHNTDDEAHLTGLVVRPKGQSEPPKVVVVYLQGNAGNPLHRLPIFQSLLSALRPPPSTVIHPGNTEAAAAAVIAVAPRSYWTSTPKRPSQKGILSDYTAVLKYTASRFPDAHIILYGHSLGGAIALCLLSHLKDHAPHPQSIPAPAPVSDKVNMDTDTTRIRGLILENPFASVPGMLVALYPQRWVPYRHLQSLVWDRWDALRAVQAACASPQPSQIKGEREGEGEGTVLTRLAQKMLVLVSEHDEVVPREMGAQLVRAAVRGSISRDAAAARGSPSRSASAAGAGVARKEGTRGTRLVVIPGALHEDAWKRHGWAEAVRAYVRGVVEEEEGGEEL